MTYCISFWLKLCNTKTQKVADESATFCLFNVHQPQETNLLW